MDFLDALVRYETLLWNELDDRLRAAGGVRLGTLFALRVVHHHDGRCRVQEVSTGLGITVGAASKLVDRLERGGHLVRAANPEDRRSSLISLTAAGRAAHDAGLAVVERSLAQHLDTDSDVAATTAVLRRLASTLEASAAEVTR